MEEWEKESNEIDERGVMRGVLDERRKDEKGN